MASSTNVSTVNGTTRVTGLSSGLDVDSIVKQTMVAERAKKYNKLDQKEQKTEWTQTAYRTVTSDIQTFSDKYFSQTASTSLMSTSNYVKYNTTSNDNAVSATTNSSATAGTHTIAVSQLATNATLESSTGVTKDVQGTTAADLTTASLSGKSFDITLDGTKRTVKLDNVTDLASLQTAIDNTVGKDKVTVSATSGVLSIKAVADSGVQAISISDPSSGATNSGLSKLGFGSGSVVSNRLDTSDTLGTISNKLTTELTYNADGQIELNINGTAMTFDKSDTLSEVMSTINKADLGVTMSYDKLTDKLALTANDTGAGNTLVVTESSDSTASSNSNFLSALLSKSTAGVDAKIIVDGQSLTRSSNTITVNGVTYIANEKTTIDTKDADGNVTSTDATTNQVTITVAKDSDSVYDYIKGFADDYNKLIDTINTELSASYDSDYPPLTQDQKDDMSDDEITDWEKKAKVGLLASDPTLTSLISDLRSSLTDSVAGQSSSIFSIGISTGDYDEKGKLTIDETKLKAAIKSDPEGVMDLFTQQATSKTTDGKDKSLSGTSVVRSLTSKDLKTRYKEEGIAYRLYDTLQKSISTTRDNAGNKGLLIEKAGTTNDATDTDNTLSHQIDKLKDRVSDEKDRLDDYEDKIYTKYSNLETYISKMNSQLSSITSDSSSSS